MLAKLRGILGKVEADFADVRYEVKKKTRIAFNGKELTEVSANSTDGYVIRILKDGGLSSVTFSKEEDAEKAVATAREQAQLLARRMDKRVALAPTHSIRDSYAPALNEDPREVPITGKIELLKGYNDIPLGEEKIASTSLAYEDVIREKYLVNSEGTEIREDLITTRIAGEIIARDGSLSQNVRVGIGGSNGFAVLRDQQEYLEQRTRIALDLLQAEPVTAGANNCILNPSLAGVLIHEALGHYSEGDIVEHLPALREKMKIGATLGNDILSIIDNPTLPDQLGFYKYDDEGVAAQPVQIMKNGVLSGRLHSRRTAAEFAEPPNGHCVAEDYRYAPIVRMGTIFVEPTAAEIGSLFEQLGDGLYILDAKGGATAGENFTFGAQYGYLVKGGKQAALVRDLNISGNLFRTLMSVVGIADDLTLSKTGGCGKGQTNIRSCHGSPHLLVNDLVVGGVA